MISPLVKNWDKANVKRRSKQDMMNFEELDDTTRKFMLDEFHTEEAGQDPYRSKLLTSEGLENYPQLMEKAITETEGNEVTLGRDLNRSGFWETTMKSQRKGKSYTKSVNVGDASTRIALTEFSTWYTRGFAKRLMEEGEKECEVYRADTAVEPRCSCSNWEGKKFSVKDAYEGHRKRYHHNKIDRAAFSIPSGPNCHHSIRRVKPEKSD